MSKRLFSKDHLWVFQTDNTVKIGISDYAQKKLKSVLFLTLPETGEQVVFGKRFGDIESVKTVSDLISPITGVVTQINEDLLDDPSAINENPYDSWLIKVEGDIIADALMDEETYKSYV